MENEEEEQGTFSEVLEWHGIDMDEFKRLLAFVFILTKEHADNLEIPHPLYILEKYVRYIRNYMVKVMINDSSCKSLYLPRKTASHLYQEVCGFSLHTCILF